jgi:hypothetical protein
LANSPALALAFPPMPIAVIFDFQWETPV